MYQDVVDLRAFYQSPLGKVTARLIRNQIRTLWPTVHGMEVLGLGYATPYLDPFRDEARHTVAIMPAQQGVIRWPRFHGNSEGAYGGNLCALANERHLPLQDASMDRILMVHLLEHSDHKRHLLREAWRTLAPGGRLLLVVPNRMGFWTRSDSTPFGHGTPYSPGQIRQMLTENMLTPTSSSAALTLPPFKSRTMISLLAAMEKTGQTFWHNIAGVLLIEAEKQIYAADGGHMAKQRVREPVFLGNQMRQNRKRHED